MQRPAPGHYVTVSTAGEPFKAFSVPVESFYESRYIKIALTMRDIDLIAGELCDTFGNRPRFKGISDLVVSFADAAKIKAETLRTDKSIFDVWASFAVSAEQLLAFVPDDADCTDAERRDLDLGVRLIRQGTELLSDITRARVPMPKSTRDFVARCADYRLRAPSC